MAASTVDTAVVTATPAHVCFAWDVLDHALNRRGGPAPAATFNTSVTTPLFVTLHKRQRDGSHELRGCIGTLSPVTHGRIGDYALKSALEDGRFSPVTAAELPSLDVSVSLLVKYEEAAHPEDWVVGTHGILLEFTVEGRTYSATYLPEVAAEQGWSQREAVLSLVRKAGYRGRVTDYSAFTRTHTTRYQSSKLGMTYDEWRAARRGPAAR